MLAIFEIIFKLGVCILVLVGAFKEITDGAKNSEDERWRMIISKSDQAALNAFAMISFIFVAIPAILKGISYLDMRFSIDFLNTLPNDFPRAFYSNYPMYLLFFVLIIRFVSIGYYKRKY